MTPTVSVAIPVFNGEEFVAQAIESVIAQTLGDLELLISDNASTDSTEAICRHYAATDTRIRYFRHDENGGAAWNFNWVFSQACGEFFVWLASDDRWDPRFLEVAVAELEHDDTAALAFSDVRIVDERDEHIGVKRLTQYRLGSERPGERFWDTLIAWHDCLPIFGVMRRRQLARSPLIPSYASGDQMLLARLSLVGPFRVVPETLFVSRRHREQSISRYSVWTDHHAYTVWFRGPGGRTVRLPQWRQFADLIAALAAAELPLTDKLRCGPAVARWTVRYRSLLARDLVVGARRALRRFRRERSADNPQPA